MVTDSVRSRVTRPAPLQDGQGVSIVSPRPWQVGQVRSMVKKPWLARTLPMPLQVRQGVGEVPALAPEPEQLSQVTDGRHADLRRLALIGFEERDLHVVAEV